LDRRSKYRTEDLLQTIRKKFPHANADATGRRRIFLDNAAGSMVLQRAVDAESKARRDYFPNVGEASWESKMNENIILEGRRAVSDFLNAPSENCIISGESATSLLFQLSYAISKDMTGKENIVTTEYEHYANITPWVELERRNAAKEVRFVKFNPNDGLLDMMQLEKEIDQNTRVVAVTGVSNCLGSKTKVAQVFQMAKQVGAYTVLDAVHMTPHVPIDVQQINSDFVVFSAYKLFGRRGSFMFGRKECLEKLNPYKVEPASNSPPTKWEMGTRDQALFASVTAVIEYLTWLGGKVEKIVGEKVSTYSGNRRRLKAALTWIEEYEQTLSKAMLGGIADITGMSDIEGLNVYGLKDMSRVHLRSPTFSFNIKGADPKKVVEYLWTRHAIICFADDFYSRALKTYHVPTAVRTSLVHFNTLKEVERFLSSLHDTLNHFR
jgi:cysteine desulfurase family protein (TIGR01976 family)